MYNNNSIQGMLPIYSKKQFLQQYVLNRALGNNGSLNGFEAALEAEKAWNQIERLTN